MVRVPSIQAVVKEIHLIHDVVFLTKLFNRRLQILVLYPISINTLYRHHGVVIHIHRKSQSAEGCLEDQTCILP